MKRHPVLPALALGCAVLALQGCNSALSAYAEDEVEPVQTADAAAVTCTPQQSADACRSRPPGRQPGPVARYPH